MKEIQYFCDCCGKRMSRHDYELGFLIELSKTVNDGLSGNKKSIERSMELCPYCWSNMNGAVTSEKSRIRRNNEKDEAK